MLIDTGTFRVAVKRPRTQSSALSARRKSRWKAIAILAVVLAVCLAFIEFQTSWFEARVFHAWARRSAYIVLPGTSPDFRYPEGGPHDVRLGHSRVGKFIKRLEESGYSIESQARQSAAMRQMMDWGLFPVYREKTQAGLRITDHKGHPLYTTAFPERVYPNFESVPEVVVRTLLFIENREALEATVPYKNPAVEWDRLMNATLDLALRKAGMNRDVSGGSTLATQIEKIRHSPGGRTESATDKLLQITSASLKVYSDGIDTTRYRREIVVAYLNSIPLAAAPGYGEVHGLGDGLWVWFDADFADVNRVLGYVEEPVTASLDRQALIYRQVLSLLLSIKKPTDFLVKDRESLDRRVDAFLPLLAEANIIPERLRDRALAARPTLRDRVATPGDPTFARRKATDSVRINLMQTLGLKNVYELDRLDVGVESSLDSDLQDVVYEFLSRLNDPKFAGRAGLRQERLLEAGDPESVIYSVTLYERGEGANLLRVQADNLNQPLNINEQTKLELGSTAKLRTLVSYLEAVVELRERLGKLTPAERAALSVASDDRLTQWAIEYLNAGEDGSLEGMLEAAMMRKYSASPDRFFTGGGLHTFSNFTSDVNGRFMTVREAFELSVNLVFVRVMRDVVSYHTFRQPGVSPEVLTDTSDPRREVYLERFAEREGRHYLTRFYQKHQGLKTDESLRLVASEMRWKSAPKLAVVYRSVRPQDGIDTFAAYIIENLLDPDLKQSYIEELYESYAPGKYSLADRAYVSGVHPLELWLLEYMAVNPEASLGQVFRASEPYCLRAYQWLFKSRNRRAQDRAIRIMLEVDTFRALHKEWRRVGFPFRWLVPSLATALGSSGDTPAALAELVGIIANDGVRYPEVRVQALHIASETPFETNLKRTPREGERVMAPEVARILRRTMSGVVENGTAVRARGSLKLQDGTVVPVGGKTGTGDNRYQMHGPGRRLIESRVVNRTATFVFLIGDRYFGTITAFVPGEQAAAYGFTSSLPVQIFKELAPAFAATMEGRQPPDLTLAVQNRPEYRPPPPPPVEQAEPEPAAEVQVAQRLDAPPVSLGVAEADGRLR